MLFILLFASSLVRALSGFGGALIAMPFLVAMFGIRTAAPLMAVIGTANTAILLLYHRRYSSFRTIKWLIPGMIAGIPMGLFLLRRANDTVMQVILGLFITVYAIYSLAGKKIFAIGNSKKWALVFGFTSGLVNGAYNTGGPPVVIYGTACSWPQRQFKGNLQIIFLIAVILTVSGHLLAGNITADLAPLLLRAVPGSLLGLVAGNILSHRVNQAAFGRIVLLLLLVIGMKQIITALM